MTCLDSDLSVALMSLEGLCPLLDDLRVAQRLHHDAFRVCLSHLSSQRGLAATPCCGMRRHPRSYGVTVSGRRTGVLTKLNLQRALQQHAIHRTAMATLSTKLPLTLGCGLHRLHVGRAHSAQFLRRPLQTRRISRRAHTAVQASGKVSTAAAIWQSATSTSFSHLLVRGR